MQNRSQRGATNDLFDVWMKKCHSLILSREGLILTLSILPCPEGWISWSIPVDGLMMRRMSVLHQNSGGIGKSIPSALEISLDPRDFPRASPSGNLSGLGKSLGSREISWALGMYFPIPPSFWWSTDTIPIRMMMTKIARWQWPLFPLLPAPVCLESSAIRSIGHGRYTIFHLR